MKPFLFLPLVVVLFSFSNLTAQSSIDQPVAPLADQVASYIDHFAFTNLFMQDCPDNSCPCEGGFAEMEVYYFGDDNVLIEVFLEVGETTLIASFNNAVSGDLLSISGLGLPNGTLGPYTYFRITDGPDICTTRIWSRCPAQAWPGSEDDTSVLGKTFDDFTVFSFTDLDNTFFCDVSNIVQDWHVGGNIISPANNTLGTRNDEAVVFITNDTPRGTILNTGEFGINTTAPTAQLDVQGDAIVNETLDVNGIARMNAPDGSTSPADGALIVAGGAGIGENLNVANNATIDVNLSVGNDGRIGNNLEVLNNAAVGVNLSVGNNADIDNDLTVNNDADVAGDLTVDNNAAVGAELSVGENASIGIDLSVGNDAEVANDLLVGNNGEVAGTLQVGTTAVPAGYLLAVDGNVICEEVRVQLSGNWPDYVFAADYPLLPLDQLETFIAEQGHLPATPSAAEVEADGLHLSQMVTIQQQQIEELFLHLIEMNEKLERLEAENQALRQKISMD